MTKIDKFIDLCVKYRNKFKRNIPIKMMFEDIDTISKWIKNELK